MEKVSLQDPTIKIMACKLLLMQNNWLILMSPQSYFNVHRRFRKSRLRSRMRPDHQFHPHPHNHIPTWWAPQRSVYLFNFSFHVPSPLFVSFPDKNLFCSVY